MSHVRPLGRRHAPSGQKHVHVQTCPPITASGVRKPAQLSGGLSRGTLTRRQSSPNCRSPCWQDSDPRGSECRVPASTFVLCYALSIDTITDRPPNERSSRFPTLGRVQYPTCSPALLIRRSPGVLTSPSRPPTPCDSPDTHSTNIDAEPPENILSQDAPRRCVSTARTRHLSQTQT